MSINSAKYTNDAGDFVVRGRELNALPPNLRQVALESAHLTGLAMTQGHCIVDDGTLKDYYRRLHAVSAGDPNTILPIYRLARDIRERLLIEYADEYLGYMLGVLDLFEYKVFQGGLEGDLDEDAIRTRLNDVVMSLEDDPNFDYSLKTRTGKEIHIHLNGTLVKPKQRLPFMDAAYQGIAYRLNGVMDFFIGVNAEEGLFIDLIDRIGRISVDHQDLHYMRKFHSLEFPKRQIIFCPFEDFEGLEFGLS